jgi:hypothetical protein
MTVLLQLAMVADRLSEREVIIRRQHVAADAVEERIRQRRP